MIRGGLQHRHGVNFAYRSDRSRGHRWVVWLRWTRAVFPAPPWTLSRHIRIAQTTENLPTLHPPSRTPDPDTNPQEETS